MKYIPLLLLLSCTKPYAVGTCLRNAVSTVKIVTVYPNGRFDLVTSSTSFINYNGKLVTRAFLDTYFKAVVSCEEFI
jgi:gamma-glutamyl:cysteine ligase YbdK (ATP-grasp superfamily)